MVGCGVAGSAGVGVDKTGVAMRVGVGAGVSVGPGKVGR